MTTKTKNRTRFLRKLISYSYEKGEITLTDMRFMYNRVYNYEKTTNEKYIKEMANYVRRIK